MARGEHALSGHRSSHLAAGLSTATEGCSTAFAVFVVVFLTLSSTAIAGFGADAAHLTTQTRQVRCFVSAPAGTDLSQLLEALKENDIQVLDPAIFALGAVKITDKIIDGISHADLVIAVLGTAASSANVLFELGCASALGKQALVIVTEGYEIPSDIKDLLYIRTTPNNREAINFALDQILNAPHQEKTHKARLTDNSKPLGRLADDLLNCLNSLGEIPHESEVQNIVREMLEASGVHFFDLHEFLERLQEESLGEIIRNERNARVHGRLR